MFDCQYLYTLLQSLRFVFCHCKGLCNFFTCLPPVVSKVAEIDNLVSEHWEQLLKLVFINCNLILLFRGMVSQVLNLLNGSQNLVFCGKKLVLKWFYWNFAWMRLIHKVVIRRGDSSRCLNQRLLVLYFHYHWLGRTCVRLKVKVISRNFLSSFCGIWWNYITIKLKWRCFVLKRHWLWWVNSVHLSNNVLVTTSLQKGLQLRSNERSLG